MFFKSMIYLKKRIVKLLIMSVYFKLIKYNFMDKCMKFDIFIEYYLCDICIYFFNVIVNLIYMFFI